MALFGKTAKQWREQNPKEKGNIRDYANVSQLVCLSNLENPLPTSPKVVSTHPFGRLLASPFGVFRLCSIVLLFSILIKHPI
jgi:hypothetical protein